MLKIWHVEDWVALPQLPGYADKEKEDLEKGKRFDEGHFFWRGMMQSTWSIIQRV